MTRYVLTSLAEEDVTELTTFVAADSPAAARRLVVELRRALRRLADHPRLGHSRNDLPEDVRLWPVRSLLVVYRAETSPLLVLRVLSGFRDVARTLR